MDNIISVKVKDQELKLKTKPGVFAKGGVDAGSLLLMEAVKINDGTLIADLGSGGGTVGIFCAKLNFQGHVHLLEDHVRSAKLAEENVELNRLKNAEVYLSDLFSAVANRSYHLIVSNPPQHLGNEFLEEAVQECLVHLKPGGEVVWVVQKHVKPLIERLFNKTFGNCKIVTHGQEHVVLKAEKHG